MWAALSEIAIERGKTLHDVVFEINQGRTGVVGQFDPLQSPHRLDGGFPIPRDGAILRAWQTS